MTRMFYLFKKKTIVKNTTIIHNLLYTHVHPNRHRHVNVYDTFNTPL
jgi:hypothetical protein